MINENTTDVSRYITTVILVGIIFALFKSDILYSYESSDFVKYEEQLSFPENDNIPYLIGIGYWKNKRNQQLPDPTKIITTYKDSTVKEKIVNYLNNASIFICFDGLSWCRFPKCESGIGCNCLTDGKYVWPSAFYHYIQDHNVSIPQEFMSHMESNSWTPPSAPDLSKYGKNPWRLDFHAKYLAKHSAYMNSN